MIIYIGPDISHDYGIRRFSVMIDLRLWLLLTAGVAYRFSRRALPGISPPPFPHYAAVITIRCFISILIIMLYAARDVYILEGYT